MGRWCCGLAQLSRAVTSTSICLWAGTIGVHSQPNQPHLSTRLQARQHCVRCTRHNRHALPASDGPSREVPLLESPRCSRGSCLHGLGSQRTHAGQLGRGGAGRWRRAANRCGDGQGAITLIKQETCFVEALALGASRASLVPEADQQPTLCPGVTWALALWGQ